MKTIRKIAFGLLIAAPLFLTPTQSRAGGIADFLHSLFDNDHHGGHGHDGNRGGSNAPAQGPGATGNAVPVNGGLIFLLVAGLGLGTKMMYDKNNRFAVDSII